MATPYDVNSTEGRNVLDTILSVHSGMVDRRRPYEAIWQAIAERIDPAGAAFMNGGGYRTPKPGTEKVFDATPGLALSRAAAATQSLVTPRHERYHGLRATLELLNEDDSCREYFDYIVNALFAARYSPLANFEDQSQRHYWGLMAYGTGAVYTDEAMPSEGRTGGVRYRAPHLSELFFAESWEGRCERVHRRWQPNSRQIAGRFKQRDGARWSVSHLPPKLVADLEKGGFQTWEVIHAVAPNEDIDPRRVDYRGMAFSAHYVMPDEKCVLHEGGHRVNPWAVSRYQTAPGEEYGRSPAWLVMPDILMLNEVRKTVIRRGQLITEPPVLTVDDGSLEPFHRMPGAVNPGWLDASGRDRVKEMETKGSLEYGLAEIQDLRGIVNDAFHVSLFQILAERQPNETATAALLKAQEKGQLLAPLLGRQQSEFLGNMIPREIDILDEAGQLPPVPDLLAQTGAQIEIEYDSPLNRMQMSAEAIGLLRTIEVLMPLAELDPGIMDAIDTDAVPGIVARSTGAPAKAIRSKDEIAQRREAREQQQQSEKLLEAAPLVGKAAKDLAQAQAAAGGAPPNVPALVPAT